MDSADTGDKLFWRAFTGNPTPQDGALQLSPDPGLGIEIDEDTVARLQQGDTVLIGSAPDSTT